MHAMKHENLSNVSNHKIDLKCHRRVIVNPSIRR